MVALNLVIYIIHKRYTPMWQAFEDVASHVLPLIAIPRRHQKLLRRYASSDDLLHYVQVLFLGLPLLLDLAILPFIARFSTTSTLITWPKNYIWRFLTTARSSVLPQILSGIFMLRLRSAQIILNILRQHHNSAASSLCSISQLTVHASHPYSNEDQTYVFIALTLVCRDRRLFVSRPFIFLNAVFARPILRLISVVHLASAVRMLLRYWNSSTFFAGSCFSVMRQ